MKQFLKLIFVSCYLVLFSNAFGFDNYDPAPPTPYIEKLQGTWFSLFNASRIEVNKNYPWSIGFPDENATGDLRYLPDFSNERYIVYSIRLGGKYSNLRLDKQLPGALEYGNIDENDVFKVSTAYIRNFLDDPRNTKDNQDPEQMFDGSWKSVDHELSARIYKNRTNLNMMSVNGPDVGGSFYLDFYWYNDVGWKGYGTSFGVSKKYFIDPYTDEKKEILIMSRSGWYAKTYIMFRE